MTRFLDREKARLLRLKGKSFSEIKDIIGVGKSTLSTWLRDMPLSDGQLRLLRDLNPLRIERYRETRRRQKENRLNAVYDRVKLEIGQISSREMFIAGLFLYWAEGTKSAHGRVEISNTDPSIIISFQKWLRHMKVQNDKIRVRLQLYSDMSAEAEIKYWSNTLGISPQQFRTPRIKESSLSGLTRKNGHGHGTCALYFDNVAMWEYITMALKNLREVHFRP